MELEELFCKLYPEYSVNGKPLSPYFDLFERGYEEAEDKMKCCSMCKYYSISFLPYWCTKNNTAPHCTSKCDKWEIKEK